MWPSRRRPRFFAKIFFPSAIHFPPLFLAGFWRDPSGSYYDPSGRQNFQHSTLLDLFHLRSVTIFPVAAANAAAVVDAAAAHLPSIRGRELGLTFAYIPRRNRRPVLHPPRQRRCTVLLPISFTRVHPVGHCQKCLLWPETASSARVFSVILDSATADILPMCGISKIRALTTISGGSMHH